MCHAVKNGKRCYSVFQADAACALFALNARLRIVELGRERIIPLSEFYTGKGEFPNCLKATEILAEIVIPPEPNQVGTYQKCSSRNALDYPEAGVAVTINLGPKGHIEDAKIVVNALAPCPIEFKKAQTLLIGNRLDEKLIEEADQVALGGVHPVNNTGMAPGYRKKMIKVLIKRSLEKCLYLMNTRKLQ